MGRTSSPGQPVTLVHGSSRKAWEDLLCALPAVARGPSQETRSLIPSRGLTSGNGVRYDYPWGQLNSGFWLRELEHLGLYSIHQAELEQLILFTYLCLNLCKPMGCSMPGSSVLHCLREFAQTHVHWVSDANQPSNSLSPTSPALFFQHQGLF